MASERAFLVGFAGFGNGGMLGEGADRHMPEQLWAISPCSPTNIWPESREEPALCRGHSLDWVVPMARRRGASKSSSAESYLAESLRRGAWRRPLCVELVT